jgi:hypothetical protein
LYEYEVKLAINKKLSSRIFDRAPINIWIPDQLEEDCTTTQLFEDNICHEVKHNPADKKSESYKLYIKPFLHGTAEQWLKFMDKLKIVIHCNGLGNDSLVCFKNVTYSLLIKVRLFMSSMTRQHNKKKRQRIVMFNVSKPLRNMCSLQIPLFLTEKFYAQPWLCSFT